jgi:glycopeptide antibiotics resistance protein
MDNKLYKRLFIGYVVAIILLITLPVNKTVTAMEHITVLEVRGDYLMHFLVFIPWGFFGWVLRKRPWSWLLLGLLFATGMEFLQYATPWRRFNINDLVGNNIGILLGMGFLLAKGQGRKVFV